VCKITIFGSITLFMLRAFFALFVSTLFLTACTQRMICPAYQSAFIYDKDALRKKFSYFQEDSTPKILTASKNSYLVAERTTYRKKIRSMQTVEMKPVYVNIPDSLKEGYDSLGANGEDGVIPGAELDLAARSVIDSIYIVDVEQDTTTASAGDSVYVISKDKETRVLKYQYSDSAKYDPATGKYVTKAPTYVVEEITFNVEQDNYMWYLRNNLVLPDVRIAKMGQAKAAKEAKAQKKGFFGFFKNLFKKKDKNKDKADTTATPQPKDNDFDYVDEEEQKQQADAQLAQPEPEKKKGIFSFLKKDKTAKTKEEKPEKKKKEKKKKDKDKDKKKDEDQPDDETPPEEKEKETDDGF
jgi:hypothetical protein